MKLLTYLLILSLIALQGCFYISEKQVEKLDKRYIPELGDEGFLIFKSNQLNKDTFYIDYSKEEALIADNEYYERVNIDYRKENVDFFNINIQTYYDDKIFLNSFGHIDFNQPLKSYRQNGHNYPDVFIFETVTENRADSRNTDVRTVWYSISRGIVRYDMKGGESYKLIEE